MNIVSLDRCVDLAAQSIRDAFSLALVRAIIVSMMHVACV